MKKYSDLKILKFIRNQYTKNPITPPKASEPYIDTQEYNGHRKTFIFTQVDNPNEYKLVDSQRLSASLKNYPIYDIYRLLQKFNLLRYNNGEDEPEHFYIDHVKLEDKISELQELKNKKWSKVLVIIISIVGLILALLTYLNSDSLPSQSNQKQESLPNFPTTAVSPEAPTTEPLPEAPITESLPEISTTEPLPEAPITEFLPEVSTTVSLPEASNSESPPSAP